MEENRANLARQYLNKYPNIDDTELNIFINILFESEEDEYVHNSLEELENEMKIMLLS